MQPKTFKNKNNDCGTAPGNLVLYNFQLIVVGIIRIYRHSQNIYG